MSCKEKNPCFNPEGDEQLGWIPIHDGNRWTNYQGGDFYPIKGYNMYAVDQITDTLNTIACGYSGFSAYCDWVWGMSLDGQRVYSVCDQDYFAALWFGDTTLQFALDLDFGLKVGQSLVNFRGKTLTVLSKNETEITFSIDHYSPIQSITYQKGL